MKRRCLKFYRTLVGNQSSEVSLRRKTVFIRWSHFKLVVIADEISASSTVIRHETVPPKKLQRKQFPGQSSERYVCC